MRKGMLASGALYVVLFSMAAAAYPGGTHFDHASVGHDFWRNTMCDVARTVALDGSKNDLASGLAQAAMTCLAVGIALLFRELASLLPSRERLGRLIRHSGVVAALGSIAVAFLPTDRHGAAHGIAIVLTGVPGFTAVALSVYGLAREPRAPSMPLVVGVLALAVAGLCFGLYVRELVGQSAAQIAVAVLERLSTLLVLAWIVTVALQKRVPSLRLD